MKLNTRFIHGNFKDTDPAFGAVMPPIYQTTSYRHNHPGGEEKFEYSRTANPTRSQLELTLASIENGTYGLCFSSGMAAIDAVMRLLIPGDEVLCSKDLYGGSYRLFIKIFTTLGIKFNIFDMGNIDNVESHINKNTRLIWIETPSNPLLHILDIEAIGALAATKKILFAVDNTFATPYLQNPLDLNADIVMHSATKYLGGHSDVLLGALIVRDKHLADQLYFIQNACGAVPGPQDCFLVLRGIKTLHVRMQRHCDNTERVANHLRSMPQVEKVYWPGFKDHPNHLLAAKQMRGYGGMVTFSLLNKNHSETIKVAEALKVFTLAESLGGVESLVGHPASMTHASIPKAEREKIGIVDSMLRLSIGIEDVEDLVADLEQAINTPIRSN